MSKTMQNKKPLTSSQLRRIKENVRNYKIENDKEVTSTELQRQKKALGQNKKTHFQFSWGDRRKLKVKPEISYLITMFFANGTGKTFVISTEKNTFTFKKRLYYLFTEEAYYDLSMNQYHLYYHENYAVPINREVQAIGNEAFFNVKPDNLKELIKFEYVKVLAGSLSFDKMLKLIVLFSIINMVLSAIVVLTGTGILKVK